MTYRRRLIESQLSAALRRGKSVLLLGARQTGKSTLAARFKPDFAVNFMRPDILRRYSARPELLLQAVEALPRRGAVKPLVFFDEIQRLPVCLDVAQDAIDRDIAQFILTGSSARQMRHGAKVNLLPGRVVVLHLDPFMLEEDPTAALKRLLLDGSLPGIANEKDRDARNTDLSAYVLTYLEEEIRAQAAVRNLGKFNRFLELAALESGNIVNFSKIAEDVGVAHTTIKAYYEILTDSLMLERIAPITTSNTRKKLTKSDKYILFDLGVRRICARERAVTRQEDWGRLLEQWVGLELCRGARMRGADNCIRFWRDPDGPEVDWIIDAAHTLIPIEVKWTDAPKERDIKHLKVFMSEHPNAKRAFVICRTPHRLKLTHQIDALPWRELQQVWHLS